MSLKVKKSTAEKLKQLLLKPVEIEQDNNGTDYTLNEVITVVCGEVVDDTLGLYTGNVQFLDTTDLTWDVDEDDVFLWNNGKKLIVGNVYLSLRFDEYNYTGGEDDDPRPLYFAAFNIPKLGCGIIQNEDGEILLDTATVVGCNLQIADGETCKIEVKTVSKTVVTGFDSETCEVTTEDILAVAPCDEE